METIKEIKQCYRSCPFWGNTMDGMECKHPHWDDKSGYANMIITQSNSRDGKVPYQCPLRIESITITYKLKKWKHIV